MLFDKDQPKICALCFYGQDYGENGVLCSKKGPVGLQDHCSKYCYDPLRRKPAPGAAARPAKEPSDFEL